MIACRGRLQREGDIIHLVAEHLMDLSDLLRSVGDRDQDFHLRHGRGDEAKIGSRSVLREGAKEPQNPAVALPAEHRAEPEIRVAVRDFR
jgi:error-prone DNA polymerase